MAKVTQPTIDQIDDETGGQPLFFYEKCNLFIREWGDLYFKNKGVSVAEREWLKPEPEGVRHFFILKEPHCRRMEVSEYSVYHPEWENDEMLELAFAIDKWKKGEEDNGDEGLLAVIDRMIEIGVALPSLREYWTHGDCEECGEYSKEYACELCDGRYCSIHKDPSKHKYEGMLCSEYEEEPDAELDREES